MKIRIPKAELLEILTRHFGVPVSEVTITKEQPSLHIDVVRKMKELTGLVFIGADTLQPFKISAIKALRTIVPGMELAEAKWAVENWQTWFTFVETKGRFPRINFQELRGSNPVTLA